MNNEPCVRLGIRISPKMREKPADSRNNSPPKVMLLTVSTSQKLMPCFRALKTCGTADARCERPPPSPALRFQRRIVARIDRLRQELLLVVSPELAHVMVGLDGLVDVLSVGLLDTADVEVADDIAEVVELDRAARRVLEIDRTHRLDHRILVVGLAAGLLQRGVDDHAVDVEAGAVEAGVDRSEERR